MPSFDYWAEAEPVNTRIGNADVVNCSEEKLLGVQIDSRLSFDSHASKLCQKSSNLHWST